MIGTAGTGQTGASVKPSGCEHDPDPDTAYTSAGLKANLRRDFDVAVEAQCRACGEWIRREQRAVTGPDPDWHLKYPVRS